ncbi:MAG: aminotransferase class IV [Campylobacterota bacterium]|nr:aminotransferase class IV [Campylobacterota bacterium]
MIDEQYFETIKCFDKEVFNLEYHKKRISKTVGMNFNLEEYIYPQSDNLQKCKVIYDKNEIIDISYSDYKIKDINSFKLVVSNQIIYNKKSTKRESIDNLYMKKGLCDEIIIVKNNLITDTSIANIAILIDDIWYTPKIPLLYGTTRERLLDNKKIIKKDISIDELLNAKKIALMNAMIGFYIVEKPYIKQDLDSISR